MTPTRPGSTREHATAERRGAARALLAQPFRTSGNDPDEMALIRRHQADLKRLFAARLRYPLTIESGFARLTKSPLSPDAPARPATRAGTPFTPRQYMYTALLCAGLLAPGVGDQILLSQLVEQLRADASSQGIAIEDTLPERRSLVAALDLLIGWGVIAEVDGSVTAWGERHAETLLNVNRSVLPHLLARPLTALTGPQDLLQDPGQQPDRAEQPRLSLRRKLIENPVVQRSELSDAERDVLSRERTELARILEEDFGLTLEVRLEGALAYDPGEELTDVPFPGPGTVRQAALLLVGALIDELSPTPGSPATASEQDRSTALAGWDLVRDQLEDLTSRHAKAWSSLAGDVEQLTAQVVAILEQVGLATGTPEGLLIHAAAARYRPEPWRAPARAPKPTDPTPAGTLGLPGADLFTTDSATDVPTDPTVEQP